MRIYQPQRMSIEKRFSDVNYRNFIDTMLSFAYEFARLTDNTKLVLLEDQPKIEIYFYSRVPSSITSIQEGLNESIHEDNMKLVFVNVETTFKDFRSIMNEVSAENFDKAAFVRVTIKNHIHESNYMGVVEFKGLLPRHAVFYVQPEEIAKHVLPKIRADKTMGLFAKYGDGMERNHHISFS